MGKDAQAQLGHSRLATTLREGPANSMMLLVGLAGPTGLEPATSCVTGRRSNQLNYGPA